MHRTKEVDDGRSALALNQRLRICYRYHIFTSCHKQYDSVTASFEFIENPYQTWIHLFDIRDRLTKDNRLKNKQKGDYLLNFTIAIISKDSLGEVTAVQLSVGVPLSIICIDIEFLYQYIYKSWKSVVTVFSFLVVVIFLFAREIRQNEREIESFWHSEATEALFKDKNI